MDQGAVFDEAATGRLLAGNEEEVGCGLALIDHHLRVRLCHWLRKQFPGMSPDDLADAWGETLVCVLQAARLRRFEHGRPLLPWLCQIARARAIDLARRRATREDLIAAVGRSLPDERAGQPGRLPGAVADHEVLVLIRRVVETLPEQQRLVLRVFVDNYPESAHMDILRREVSRAAGAEVTRAAVKRALQEGRRKVRAFLRNHGYALGEGEDT